MGKMLEISLFILSIAFALFIISISFYLLFHREDDSKSKNKLYEIKYCYGVCVYVTYVKAKTKNDALIKLCKKEKTINKIESIKEVVEDD